MVISIAIIVIRTIITGLGWVFVASPHDLQRLLRTSL